MLLDGAVNVTLVKVLLREPLVALDAADRAARASALLALQSQVIPRSVVEVVRVNAFPLVLASTPVLGELIPVAVVSARVGAVGWATTVAVALAEVPGLLSWL